MLVQRPSPLICRLPALYLEAPKPVRQEAWCLGGTVLGASVVLNLWTIEVLIDRPRKSLQPGLRAWFLYWLHKQFKEHCSFSLMCLHMTRKGRRKNFSVLYPGGFIIPATLQTFVFKNDTAAVMSMWDGEPKGLLCSQAVAVLRDWCGVG